METYQDVIVNLDILVGVPAKTHEDALEAIEKLSTEELLNIALNQLPFTEAMEDDKPITIN